MKLKWYTKNMKSFILSKVVRNKILMIMFFNHVFTAVDVNVWYLSMTYIYIHM